MKTYGLLCMAVIGAVMTGCSGTGDKGKCNKEGSNCASDADRYEEYTGVLPAADSEGIEYTLSLEYDSDDNFKEGDFKMRQVYLNGEGSETYDSKGDFEVLKGTPGNASQRYLRLISEPRNGAPADTTYFLVTSDSVLTLVGSDLEPAASGLNYDLKLKK